MNKDLIFVIEQMGREKGIDKEVLFEALESALLSASQEDAWAPGDNIRMHIDRKTGELRVFAARRSSRRSPIPSSRSASTDARR